MPRHERLDDFAVVLRMQPDEFDTMTRLAELTGCSDAAGMLQLLTHHAVGGVLRPGSHDRAWLNAIVGRDWHAGLVSFETFSARAMSQTPFAEVCPRCKTTPRWPSRLLDGARLCPSCYCEDHLDRRLVLTGGRPPAGLIEFGEPGERRPPVPPESCPSAGRPPEYFEAAAARYGAERHRRRRGGEGGCRSVPGLMHPRTQVFLCPGCQRWRCFCRGGWEVEVAAMRSLCDQCSEVYLSAQVGDTRRTVDQVLASVASVLTARRDQLLPTGFIDKHLAASFRRLLGAWEPPPAMTREAVAKRWRAMAELGWRMLSRATAWQKVAVIVAGWRANDEQTRAIRTSRDYLRRLSWACMPFEQDDWGVDSHREEAQWNAASWLRDLEAVFTDRGAQAVLQRDPELQWLTTTVDPVDQLAGQLFDTYAGLHPCAGSDRFAPGAGPCPGCGLDRIRWRDLNPESLTARRFRNLARELTSPQVTA